MNDLTPSFERETGQVILEGLPAGVAGEALLVPVRGLELAFDRADGRLCRAVADVAGADGSIAVSEQVAALLVRLFGAEAASVGAAASPRAFSPDPELAGTLSSLARLDAARATSPIPSGSPWWAAEAAELAAGAGLHERARAEARQAAATLLGQPDSRQALAGEAVSAALAVAEIIAASEPEAASRLADAIARQSVPRPAAPQVPGLDVSAEVENLEKDRVRLAGLHWVLDPGLVPAGLFRLGLSPYSDLYIRHEGAKGRVTVEARPAPGAHSGELSHCLVRLVDPSVRRVLAQATFTRVRPQEDAGVVPARVNAQLRLPFPLYEVQESWIEVVRDRHWPVRSVQGHRIKRALRWADAALRAERAPAGVAPRSTRSDWTALATAGWEQCRRDWEAAGDVERAYLAAQRLAAFDPAACLPQAPSATAAVIARRPPIHGPAYLAEVLGEVGGG